jgi:hypothetical protein
MFGIIRILNLTVMLLLAARLSHAACTPENAPQRPNRMLWHACWRYETSVPAQRSNFAILSSAVGLG